MLNICGIIAFLMLYVYDLNLIYKKNRFLKNFFMIGSSVIVLTTLINIIIYFPKSWNFTMIVYTILALLSCGGLIYTLFFALDVEKAYGNDCCDQTCIKSGIYALCRHPGVIWMALMYLFLYLAFKNEDMLFMLVVYNGLNLGYVILQDIIIFPKQFVDYQQYKKIVPFLIPTIKSLKECIRSFQEVAK